MSLIPKLVRIAFANRLRQIENFRRNGVVVQQKQIEALLSKSGQCDYLKSRGIGKFSEFQTKLPVVQYEDLAPEVEKILRGDQNVLWSTPTRWFAKSSGTTNDKSKYIPISKEALHGCHFKGGRDLIAIASDIFPQTRAFSGKALTLGGSHKIVEEGSGALCGDLSAIMIENTPKWFSGKRVPSRDAALTPDFEQKVAKICRETVNKNITSFAGVPSWNLILMNKILEYTGKDNIHEVWPDMSLFAHGGISFTPYREQYQKLLPSSRMRYIETYNASEGFFSIQDDPNDASMLLMLDYGIYYEFLPMSDLHNHSALVSLEGVRTGVNYAMIITTNGGLWRYMIGDTVEFTSLSPYKIRITGRTKQFINAFGEELIADNAEKALSAACKQTGAIVKEYTVAPVFMGDNQKGRHQWVVEFEKDPSCILHFTKTLDKSLQSVNSDYEAKRFKSTTMDEPLVTVVENGTFYRWMGQRGKVGGQNKVPRLSADRKVVESIISMGDI